MSMAISMSRAQSGLQDARFPLRLGVGHPNGGHQDHDAVVYGLSPDRWCTQNDENYTV